MFDVAGPNGYLVHRVLPEFCQRTGAEVKYVPVLLGGLFKATGNRPPWAVYQDVPAKVAYANLEFQRFLKSNGISKFRMNPHFPPNSLSAMRALVAAGRIGVFAPALEAMMVAMWEEGANVNDRDGVRDILTRAALDGDAIMALSDDPHVKAELMENTEKAANRGAFGIPTFFVGDEMFFGKERLAQVASALAQL